MTHQIKYNTEEEDLKISEYGRNIQEYVKHICSLEDKEQRTKLVKGLVEIIAYMNPTLKQQEGYERVIWDHLHIISDFSLDVDSPYPIPELSEVNAKPDPLGYDTNRIRFRFYGRNLQLMVEKATTMEEGEDKKSFINVIASFMFNSSRNWNNENLSQDVLAEHIETLSKGQLKVVPEELNITVEQQRRSSYSNTNTKRRNSGKTRGGRTYSRGGRNQR